MKTLIKNEKVAVRETRRTVMKKEIELEILRNTD